MKIKMNKQTNLSLENTFERFIKTNNLRNLSQSTIRLRQDSFTHFYKFIDTHARKNNKTILISDVDQELIEDYILYMKDELKLKIVTLNTYLRNNKAFLYWCMKNNYCETFSISLLKEPDTIKKTYNDYELEQLLKKPNIKKCRFTEYRNWVIINFLYGTGVRKGTLINLKIEDIDFANELFSVKVSKTGAVSILPLPSTLTQILREYIAYRKGEKTDYLFCTELGEQLTTNGLYNAIKRYNKKKGIELTSVHAFRHTFAKGIIKNHGDVFRLQKLMIHTDLKTTKKYVELFSTDLQEGYSEYNPLDTFMKKNQKEPIKMKK